MADLGIFWVEFRNNIAIFKISALDFVWLQKFVKE